MFDNKEKLKAEMKQALEFAFLFMDKLDQLVAGATPDNPIPVVVDEDLITPLMQQVGIAYVAPQMSKLLEEMMSDLQHHGMTSCAAWEVAHSMQHYMIRCDLAPVKTN